MRPDLLDESLTGESIRDAARQLSAHMRDAAVLLKVEVVRLPPWQHADIELAAYELLTALGYRGPRRFTSPQHVERRGARHA